MAYSERYALDAAKEIVIARMSNASFTVSSESGERVGEFYEEIFKKIAELAKFMDD